MRQTKGKDYYDFITVCNWDKISIISITAQDKNSIDITNCRLKRACLNDEMKHGSLLW